MTSTLYESRDTEEGRSSSAQPQAFKRFPIRILSERTGVGTSTLRAWERRYGLINPERTPKGHRLYSEMDVARIERILVLLEEGHSLQHMAQTLAESQDSLIETASAGEPSSDWLTLQSKCLDAIRDFSSERLEAIFNDVTSLYPIDLATEKLIEPVLVHLGSNWRGRVGGIAEEHFFSSWLRNRLGQGLQQAAGQARGARIICACMPGSHHEIGLTLFALSAMVRGYRVLYFGTNLPLEELPYIAERSAAKGIVLSAHARVSGNADQHLVDLMQQINTPIFLGGPGSAHHAKGFEQAGGIPLGPRISVALKVLTSHIPPHPIPGDRRRNARKVDE
jgi:DNA-binding transcriptional MerR regulator